MNIPIKHDETKPTILINFILDESGSMLHQRDSVISGFNEYLQDHRRKTDANYLVSLTKFDYADRIQVLYVGKPVADCANLTHSDYKPDGNTALYDAIGRTVTSVESRMREMSVRPKVLTFIFTDGEENASTQYNAKELNRIITAKEESKDWVFTFIGATRASLESAKDIGIKGGNSFQYNSNDFYGTIRAMSSATQAYTNNVSAGQCYTSSFFKDAGLNSVEDIDSLAKLADTNGGITTTTTTDSK